MESAPYYDSDFKQVQELALKERDQKIAVVRDHPDFSNEEKDQLILIIKAKHLGLI